MAGVEDCKGIAWTVRILTGVAFRVGVWVTRLLGYINYFNYSFIFTYMNFCIYICKIFLCVAMNAYIDAHTNRWFNFWIGYKENVRCWIFQSVCTVWHPPSLLCLGNFTSFVYLHMKLLLTYKPCAWFQICVLINTFVDKRHLSLQKRFQKAEAFTAPSLASSWPCLLPDSRKAKTSPAWLQGAANVDSDQKILFSGFLGCLCLSVLFKFLSGNMKAVNF